MEQTIGSETGRLCPECGKRLVWRRGRYGTFHGCPGYPLCKGKIGAPRGSSVAKSLGSETGGGTRSQTSSETQTQGETKMEESQTPKIQASQTSQTSPALGDALWQAISPFVESRAREIATQAAQDVVAGSSRGPLEIVWKIGEVEFARIEGVSNSKVITQVMKRIRAGLKNILLVGPAGSGKTTIAAQVAEALKRPFAAVSCTSGMPEWHLTGRSTPNLQTGENVYAESELVRLYHSGGVFLADEFDAADPNVVLVLNSAIANGHWHIPGRAAPVTRHEDFIFIAAANTFGNGANRQYVGRNQLDASSLSRFACAVIEVDYDRDLEAALVSDARVLSEVWAIRDRVTKLGLRRIVGTRELVAVARLVHAGDDLLSGVSAMMTGWTADEVSKALAN